MEEVTEWDTEYTCQHSYNRRCAKSLTTTYNAAQVRITAFHHFASHSVVIFYAFRLHLHSLTLIIGRGMRGELCKEMLHRIQ